MNSRNLCFQERLYCSNAKPVKIMPSATRGGSSHASWRNREVRHSMLKAAQKHFATLSKYLSMKDTKRPHMAKVTTVACANALNPSNRFRPGNDALFASMHSDAMPKINPNKYSCIFFQCIESSLLLNFCFSEPAPFNNFSENAPPAPDAMALTKTNA